MLIEPLIYGLQLGVNYILVALGLTFIFRIMNIINLAHGVLSAVLRPIKEFEAIVFAQF